MSGPRAVSGGLPDNYAIENEQQDKVTTAELEKSLPVETIPFCGKKRHVDTYALESRMKRNTCHA